MSSKALLIILIIFPVTIFNLSCEDPHPEVLEYLFFNDDIELLAEIGIGDNKGGQISVTNPSGGETFLDSDTILVEWNVDGDVGGNSVKCGFSDNAGLEWFFTGSLDNDGYALITLPDLYYDQTQCLIGIWSENQPDSHYDIIDGYFNYDADSNYYEILYPNSGEPLRMGDDAYIVYRPHGNVKTYSSYSSNVNVYYSLFGGDSWYELDPDYSFPGENDLHFLSWNVPQLQSTNSNCMLKIEDQNTLSWYGVTNSTFTITDEEASDTYDMDFELGESLSGWSFDGNWTITDDVSYSGNYSAYCNGEVTSTMKVNKTLINSGFVTFYYKADFYYGYAYIRFLIDGVEYFDAQVDQNDYQTSGIYFVEQGQHDFEWIWESTSSHSGNYISIDAISFP